MPDLVVEAKALRDTLTRRHNALFRDGEPIQGTGEERRRLRALISKARKRVVRRIVKQVMR
jgi:hypothetical protein